jgi:hypothetical protein
VKGLDARLEGTGRLADDLYLMSVDDRTGKGLLAPRAIGMGLAAALLTELVVERRVRVVPEAVLVSDRTPLRDGVLTDVLGRLTGEAETHEPREWLIYLGLTAADEVAGRLGEAGYLQRAQRKWGRAQPWIPVSSDAAYMPVNRALRALNPSYRLALYNVALVALAEASGLGPRLQASGPDRCLDQLPAVEAQLGPDLRELIVQLRLAVATVVLSQRS